MGGPGGEKWGAFGRGPMDGPGGMPGKSPLGGDGYGDRSFGAARIGNNRWERGVAAPGGRAKDEQWTVGSGQLGDMEAAEAREGPGREVRLLLAGA